MKLLSIVIPTRGREYYCIEAIKDILSYERDDFELVICDNSDTDKIEDYLNEHPDCRVVYQHIRGRVNSVINMDMAMQMAFGEYVCMIGDDDTILPDIFEIVEWARKNDYVSITPKHPITYHWPIPNSTEGKVFWQESWTDFEVTKFNCEEQLQKFVGDGLIHYSEYLPRVYHGLVRKNILDAIRSQAGHIIGGLSPDVYLAVSVACNCKEFIVINRPFTVGGACPKSATSDSNNGGHRGDINSAPHLYKRGEYFWDNRIPAIFTVESIWGETAMHAFQEMKRLDLIRKVNQGCLFAELLKNNHSMGKMLYEKIISTELIMPKWLVIYSLLKTLFYKAIYRLIKGYPNYVIYDGINNIKEAVLIYKKYSFTRSTIK